MEVNRSDGLAGWTLIKEFSDLHTHSINSLSFSLNGKLLVSGSNDKKLWQFDMVKLEPRHRYQGHPAEVTCTSYSPDGSSIAAADADGNVRVWNSHNDGLQYSHGGPSACFSVAYSPDGKLLAAGYWDGSIVIWDVAARRDIRTLRGHQGGVNCLLWSRVDPTLLVSGSHDRTVRLWRVTGWDSGAIMRGHAEGVTGLRWVRDGKTLASCSGDATIRTWDVLRQAPEKVLIGHTQSVKAIDFSFDGRLLVSKSQDDTVMLWDVETWKPLASLNEPTRVESWKAGLAFDPVRMRLATLGENGTTIRIWQLDCGTIHDPQSHVSRRRSAKVVLVGDQGVGKTALCARLLEHPSGLAQSSTDREVHRCEQGEVIDPDGAVVKQEMTVWDFPGTPGSRAVQPLYLHNTAVALIVIDSRYAGQDFASVRHYVHVIRKAHEASGGGLPRILLVAGRTDRGDPGRAKIDPLVRELGLQGYYPTSAKEGWGIDELRDAVKSAIPWADQPCAVSDDRYRSIEDFLLASDGGRVVVSSDELFTAYCEKEKVEPDRPRLRETFELCVRLQESLDRVKRFSFGGLIALRPVVVDAYALSLVEAARSEPDGTGCIALADAQQCCFEVPPTLRLKDRRQEQLLGRAIVEDLMRQQVAVREYTRGQARLVFPAHIQRKHEDYPSPKNTAATVTFTDTGSVFWTLVIQLHYSGKYKRWEQFQNAAKFFPADGVPGWCGVLLIAPGGPNGGPSELRLFYDDETLPALRNTFEQFIGAHLRAHVLTGDVVWTRAACPSCLETLTPWQVAKIRSLRKSQANCPVCMEPFSLEGAGPPPSSRDVARMSREASARQALETAQLSFAAEVLGPRFQDWAKGARQVALLFSRLSDVDRLAEMLSDQEMKALRCEHVEQAQRLLDAHGGYHEARYVEDGHTLMMALHQAEGAFAFAQALAQDPGHSLARIHAALHLAPASPTAGGQFDREVRYTVRILEQASDTGLWLSAIAKQQLDQTAAASRSLPWVPHPQQNLTDFPGEHLLYSLLLNHLK